MNRFRERIGAGPPVLIAHRGDSAHAPENTIEAALKGHASGAFAWEFDVHLSRDGVPFVVHDDSLERTTDVRTRFAGDERAARGYRVAEFDAVEIASLDAGSWFVDPAGGPRSAVDFGTFDILETVARENYASGKVRIPSLREALSISQELDWPVNVELKTFPESDSELLSEVLKIVDQLDVANLVLISSFDHNDVARAARRRPEIATAALIETPLINPGLYTREIVDADYLNLSASALGAESRSYRRAPSPKNLRDFGTSELRIPRLVYTVNDIRPEGLATHLFSLGIEGLFTDDPTALVALLDRCRDSTQPCV